MKNSQNNTITGELNTFAQRNGISHQKIFSDLLDYIIAGFDPEKKPIDAWQYDESQTRFFMSMAHSYFLIMESKLEKEFWYDAWGDLFMDLMGRFTEYRGQFFTPASLTDAMADVVPEKTTCSMCGAFGMRTIINDPACGSSRTLLSAYAKMLRDGKDRPYLIGEDLDQLCVKMSAINMCVHGCFGEVICHDSLEEHGGVKFGYIINEGMYPFPGVPTIRRFDTPEHFVCCRLW